MPSLVSAGLRVTESKSICPKTALILLSILALTGFLFIAIGIIGIKIKSLRQIQHEILYHTRKNK